MAQLDPSIILQARQPQIESPVNNLAKLMQVQGMQQQNQLGQMKLDEARYTGERRNKLASLLQPEYATPEAREDALTRGGYLDEAEKLRKSRLDGQKSGVELDTSRQKLATERYNAYRTTIGALSQRQDLSKDLVIQAGQELVTAGVLPAEMFQQSITNLPDDPNALRARLREGVAAQLSPEKQFEIFAPKAEKIDNGQTIGFRDMNPNSPTYGQNTGGAAVQKLQSPDSVASQATARRGQDLKFQTDSGANAIAGQAIVSKKIQDVELKLQDDYRAESKGFSETSTAMKKIMGAIETADKNPGSALAAGTAFMKLLDPNSVVRESELGMALNASGWFDRALNVANTLQSGRIMTATQQKNLKAAAENLFEEAKGAQLEVDKAYEQRAKAYGADPTRVIVDRGQKGAKPTKAPPGLPTGWSMTEKP